MDDKIVSKFFKDAQFIITKELIEKTTKQTLAPWINNLLRSITTEDIPEMLEEIGIHITPNGFVNTKPTEQLFSSVSNPTLKNKEKEEKTEMQSSSKQSSLQQQEVPQTIDKKNVSSSSMTTIQNIPLYNTSSIIKEMIPFNALTTFNGKGDVDLWLEELENIGELSGWDQQMFCLKVHLLLKEEAASWLRIQSPNVKKSNLS